jgi:Tfp pilus assembly protein PilO
MKFKTTQFLILMLIANICVGVGYYWFFNFIKTETENNSILASKISLGIEQNDKLGDLQAAVKDTEVERTKLSSLFLANGSEVAFIEQIENLAKVSGLEEKTNNVSEALNQVSGAKSLDIQLTVTGDWNNVMYFLGQLENLPYSLNIKNVSLNRQSSDSKNKTNLWIGAFDFSVIESL